MAKKKKPKTVAKKKKKRKISHSEAVQGSNLASGVDMESEHNFQGSLEQWEERVFQNVAVFRLHRFNQQNQIDIIETPSFREAMITTHQEIANGYRVLVYAWTGSGRYCLLPPDKWNHYAELWLKRGGA